MLSLREYAEKQHVSYEAVRKQLARYREELGEHIIKQGRKQFLDEEAEAFLDEKRKGNPIIVMEQAKDEKIEELTAQVEALTTKVLQLQDQIIARDDKVMELQERLLLLSAPQQDAPPEQPKEDDPPRKWWQFWK